jgi:hypothetical protein
LFEVIEEVIGETIWQPLATDPTPEHVPELTRAAELNVDDFIASLA